MRKLSLLLALLFVFTCLGYTQTVKIGNQIWMTKNLSVDKFRNGDPIPEAKTAEEWKMAGENKQPAWCYYDNDPDKGVKFGKLYNWYAVTDPRGLAPRGFHLPVMADWDSLFFYLKFKPDSSWHTEYTNYPWSNQQKGINTKLLEEFNIILTGGRFHESGIHFFYFLNEKAWWWSSSNANEFIAYCVSYSPGYGSNIFAYFKEVGCSVRCIKD